MLVYQSDNSISQDHIQIDLYTDFSIFPHFHRDLEFFLVLEGEIDVVVEGRTETAQVGDLGFLFSSQIHAYQTPKHSKVLMCPFSGSFVRSFLRETEGYIGEHAVVPCGDELVEYIKSCYLLDTVPDKMTIKATLYAICARYLQYATMEERNKCNDDLLYSLLAYVEQNYRENITMKSAARSIGYDENYLSRFFNQRVGMNFRRFLNQYRVEYACNLLESSNSLLCDIAMDCGFQNIRNFNRSFLDIIGETPSSYKCNQERRKKTSLTRQRIQDNTFCP